VLQSALFALCLLACQTAFALRRSERVSTHFLLQCALFALCLLVKLPTISVQGDTVCRTLVLARRYPFTSREFLLNGQGQAAE